MNLQLGSLPTTVNILLSQTTVPSVTMAYYSPLQILLSLPPRHRYGTRRCAQYSQSAAPSSSPQTILSRWTKLFCLTCDACGMPLQKGDKMVLVFTRQFPNGNWTFVKNLFTLQPCTEPWPYYCVKRVPGCATVHDECFNFAIGPSPSKEKLNHFGRALVWRHCTSVRSVCYNGVHCRVKEPDGFPQALIIAAGKQLGVPMFERLPPEILTLIHSYSRNAAFWGFVKILSLKLRLAAVPRGTPLISVPLATIESWERGDISPVFSEVSHPSIFLCITLDSDGIRQVEQVANYPCALREVRQRTQRFIVANRDSNITASFKDGICWLDRSKDHPTAAPPLCFEGCSMISKTERECAYFETVSLSRSDITGITFQVLYGPDRSFNITCHTRAYPWKPTCLSDYDYLPAVYLPMPPNDRILWLQVRSSRTSWGEIISTMLETKLSGVIHIGPQHTTPFKTRAFSNLPQMMICEFDYSRPQQVLAVYPRGDSPNSIALDDGTRGPQFSLTTKPSRPRTWSWAPLEGIQHVQVFQHEWKGFMGMHITYENGGQRFVGEIPVPCETVEWSNPSCIYIKTTSPAEHLESVSFSPLHGKIAPASTIKQYDLEGELHYWHGYAWGSRMRILPSGSWRRTDVVV